MNRNTLQISHRTSGLVDDNPGPSKLLKRWKATWWATGAVMALALGGAGNAVAQAGWYTCDVSKTGAGWGNIYLHLGCGSAITPRWFVAGSDQANEMLATALTAVSAQKSVQVYLTGSQAYSEIRACYVVQ